MIIVQSLVKNNKSQISFRVSLDGKTTMLKKYPIDELKKLISKDRQQIKSNADCHFRGLKLEIQFGNVFLGPDSSLQFDCVSPVRYQTLNIISHGRIYLNQIKCNNLILKCRSVRFFAQNSVQGSCQFRHYQNSEQAQIFKKHNVQDSSKGSFQVCKQAKLSLKRILISLGANIIISEEAIMSFLQNHGKIMADKSHIEIKQKGKIQAQSRLFIKIQSIINRGYITSRSKQEGVMNLFSKSHHNFGQIKSQNLFLSSQQMYNHTQAAIQSTNGKIEIENIFYNKGSIITPQLSVWSRSMSKSSRAKLQNNGNITAKIVRMQTEYCNNSGIICCSQFIFHGKYQKNLLKNKGVISSNKISMLDVIFLNSESGAIYSDGDLQLYIQGWINQGQIQNTNRIYVSNKELISNKGFLKLNQGFINSSTMNNQGMLKIDKHVHMNIRQMFVIDKKGSIFASQLSIMTKRLKNLGTMNIDKLQVEAETFSVGQTGKISSKQANMNVKTLRNQGKAQFQKLTAKSRLQNKGNFKANKIDFVGDYIKNQKQMEINSGKIYTQLNYIDKNQAIAKFRNLDMVALNDDTMQTEGQIQFQNVDFHDSFKYFYNTKQVSFDRVQLKLDGMHIRDLKMKNTNITLKSFQNFEQQEEGRIWNKGGKNSLNQGQKLQHVQHKENQFCINIKNSQYFKKIKIICEEDSEIVIGCVNPFTNGYNLLNHPIAVGNFSKRLICKDFYLPGAIYPGDLKNTKFKNSTKIDKKSFENMTSHEIANTGQKQLILETQNMLFGGSINYSGNKLNICSKNLHLSVNKIQVPDGILRISTQENLFITHSYLQAKGIQINSLQYSEQASKLCATTSDLLIDACNISVQPAIHKKKKTTHSGDSKQIRKWEQAITSQYTAEGSIIIRAQQYIKMISPNIESKKDLILSSPNTHIQGIYLYQEKRTQVEKQNTFGGSKTNVYATRNDKPLPAFLKGNNIIFEGNAKINANLSAKKIFDLTDKGLHLFYVVGYKGNFQNREFSNFFSKGVQGYMKTKQKFLKANLKQVEQIIRDENLPGKMVFDTVQWGKIKPVIRGKYQQLVKKPKSWSKQWQHETLGDGLVMVISMVAAYAGANFLGPALASAATITNQTALMAINASASAICSKFATSLAVTGDLGKALKSTMSKDTVISAAANFALDYAFQKLASKDYLDIKIHSKDFKQCIKAQFLKTTLSKGIDAVKTGNFKNILKVEIKQIIATSLAVSFGYGVDYKYKLPQGIDYCINKCLHGVIGFVQGLIKGGNLKKMLAHAITKVVTKIALQSLVTKYDYQTKKKTSDNIKEQFQNQIFAARIVGGSIGAMLSKDLQGAFQSASNTVNTRIWEMYQEFHQLLEINEESFSKKNFGKKQIEGYHIRALVSNQAYCPTDQERGQNLKGLKDKYVLNKQLQKYQVYHPPNASQQDEKDVCVYRNNEQKKIIFGIRGTDCFKDGLDDAKILLTNHASLDRENHTKQYINNIMKEHPDYKPVIVGHSLGGNLAGHIGSSLKKLNRNLEFATFNPWHGFYEPVKQNGDRFTMRNQLPFNHGINNFVELIYRRIEGK